MFSGLVETTGQVVMCDDLGDAVRMRIDGGVVVTDAQLGDSIAVNGVCLTVAGLDAAAGTFDADVMQESLDRSVLGDLVPGARVNLERALRADARLGGHIMQGHVDGTSELLSRSTSEHWDILRFQLPKELAKYVVEKGSIAISGVSLTVSAVSEFSAGVSKDSDSAGGAGWFEVSLIPTTLAETTLGELAVGQRVNLEVDIIGKYVEKLMAAGVKTGYSFPSNTD